MAISYIRVACAAVALIGFAAGHAGAQPKKDKPTPIEATNAATNATRVCTAIWADTDRENLESDYRAFKSDMQAKLEEYRQGREELIKNIDALVDQLDVVSLTGVLSSAAKVQTRETADEKGILSKAQIKALGAAAWDDSNKEEEAKLRAKLTALRAEQAALQRRLLGWFAVATIVNQCFDDQIKYVSDPKFKPPPPPTAPATPPGPQVSNDIRLVKGTVSGGWHASCTYDKSTYPADGRFSMVFKGDRKVSAAFVDGNAASVNGTIGEGGFISGNGTVNMQGFVVRVTMQGRLYRRADGSLFGSGTFQSTDGGDIKCKGTWSG